MNTDKRKSYEAGFQLKVVEYAEEHENREAERELGGIPSSSAVISAHAEYIEAYIQNHIGVIKDEENMDFGNCGSMFFNRTLLDWSNYDINNRTRFDATVSSGFAIMANFSKQKVVDKKDNQINLNFAKYSNKGFVSKIIS